MDKEPKPGAASDQSGQRLVYVMPEYSREHAAHAEIHLKDLWSMLRHRKWWVVAVTSVFAFASVAYALFATEWYRAETLLAPAEESSTPSFGGQLGGLAALAGVSVGGSDSTEAVATLKSREFAREFIQDLNLMPQFFADDWNAEAGEWVVDDLEDVPDIRDAVKKFHDTVLKVNEDLKTGLVTLAIDWTDAETAAEWANLLVRRLNSRLRERSLKEAEANVTYLQAELAKTNVVTLQQSIGRLLESELQKLMLARGNEEFAFRVIDTASAPKIRTRPKRTLIVVLGTMLGILLAVFGSFLVYAMRSDPDAGEHERD